MFHGKKKIHLVGVGGIGMSALARLLLENGHDVSGSDLESSILIDALRASGASIGIGHRKENVGQVDYLVYSSAVAEDNPELIAAAENGIPLVGRAKTLSELIKEKAAIIVSGSHGKTTTTSLIAMILDRAGYDSGFAVGGEVNSLGGNARMGKGRYFVAESDESDGSFLEFEPVYSVVTNIDHEHLDYYRDFKNAVGAYRSFIRRTRREGCVFGSFDCPHVREIIKDYPGERVSFGLTDEADFCPGKIGGKGNTPEFDCIAYGRKLGRVKLPLPGRHNVVNALGAVAVCIKLGVDFEVIQEALSSEWGIKRRFQVRRGSRNISVVEDYAHHPTEISAVLEAGRQWCRGRLVVVFQPHRYTRTKYLKDEFADSLSTADYVVLTDIYPASEKPIAGVSSRDICHRLRRCGHREVYHLPLEEVNSHLLRAVRPDDTVMVIGAGNVGEVAEKLAENL